MATDPQVAHGHTGQCCLLQAVCVGCKGKPQARSHAAEGREAERVPPNRLRRLAWQSVQPQSVKQHLAHKVGADAGGATLKLKAGQRPSPEQ